MAISVVTPPTAYPVTLDEAKLHCRVDGTAEDTLLAGLIAAATDYVERYTGRSIGTQTLALTLVGVADEMLLPRGPVQSVASIKYYATTQQTLAASVYELAEDSVLLASGQSWPDTDDRADAVTITYAAGYTDVPAAIKQAILLLIGDWYGSRENTALGSNQPAEMPHAVTALLANYRLFGF